MSGGRPRRPRAPRKKNVPQKDQRPLEMKPKQFRYRDYVEEAIYAEWAIDMDLADEDDLEFRDLGKMFQTDEEDDDEHGQHPTY